MKLNNKLIGFLTSYILVVYMSGCANPVSPTGGEKDQQPPKIISSRIIQKEYQKKLLITFDENIQFKNNIELSPYKKRSKPEVVISRNTLIITLDSNTNSINFNDAIKDLNEGNQANLHNLIIGKDTNIKYYKYETHPKIKEVILAYSQLEDYLYPYNSSKKGYLFGDGLPTTNKLNTYIFIDANKNQKYDSTEWAYYDQLPSYQNPNRNKNDSIQIIQTDTIGIQLYPPINTEIKYWHDSNAQKTAIIINQSEHITKIRENNNSYFEIHGDSIIVSMADFNSFYKKYSNHYNFKTQKISSKGSNKIDFYQFINGTDTIFFQEKSLHRFGNKSKDSTITKIKTDKPLLLDMTNPFTNPYGSSFMNIPSAQDYIKNIEDNLNIQFISYVQIEKTLGNELSTEEKQKKSKLKPKEIKKLGRIQIQNDSNFNVGLSLYKETTQFHHYNIHPGNNEVILPLGNYYYFTWKDENKDGICNQPEEILEYFFQIEVLEKLENTIIVKKTKIQEKKMGIPAIIQSE